MNISLIDQAIEDLKDFSSLIPVAIEGLIAMKKMHGLVLQQAVAKVVNSAKAMGSADTHPGQEKPKRKYKNRAIATDRSCEKHPGNTEWEGKKGSVCVQCRREYQKNRRLEKGATPRTEKPTMAAIENELHRLADANRPKDAAPMGDEIEYSKPLTCSKCRATNVRYSRHEDADPATGCWMCPSGCAIRISHVMVKVDRNYSPEAA